MKPNNQLERPLERVVLRKLLWKLLLFTGVYLAVILLTTTWLVEPVSSLLNNILGNLYWPLTGLKEILIIGIYFLVVVVLCVRSATRSARYVTQTAQALQRLLQPGVEIESFPQEVKYLEQSLRHVRSAIFEKERQAKDAEQRKNDLVVYLAHDLKTPLASIIGYLSLLEESPDLPVAQRAKYTSITLDKAYRLEQLINEFFDITRFNLQTIELARNQIDLSFMLKQMVDEFYPIFEEKHLQVRTYMDRPIHIVADADKLARVFDNLLRNAVSYSYPNSYIEIGISQNNSYTAIAVRNQGDPIPKQQLDHIFEKFFRLDSARATRTGGAGLGLAIAKQIVELHGGSIQVESNETYTEFLVLLPVQTVRKT